MKPEAQPRRSPPASRTSLVLAAGSLSCLPLLSGCLVVGYSRPGGWFVFPGLGILLLIALLLVVLRR